MTKTSMDIYKEYLYQLRKLLISQPYLIITSSDVTSILKRYVKLLDNVKFEDGSYHTYYGEIKKIVNSFTFCWTEKMDEAFKESDKYTHIMNRDKLLDLFESTVNQNEVQQIDFAREFLPVKCPVEQEVYTEIEDKFNDFMDRLYQLKTEIQKLDKQEKVDDFTKEHFLEALNKKNELFRFTHSYISSLLANLNTMDRLRVSLEELQLHARNNLKSLQKQCDTSLHSLLNQLYDKNKEHLSLARRVTRSSLDIAEVQRSMDIIKDRIEDSKQIPVSYNRVGDEFWYWQRRLTEFYEIAEALTKLDVAEKTVLEQEGILKEIQCPFIPGAKGKCREDTAKQLQENLRTVREMKANAAGALMSFLSVRGHDRIIYKDEIGQFFVDEHGHKVYFFDFGLKLFHVDCEGHFVQVDETEKCYYDDLGRYILDSDGSKIYKIETCASAYKLQGDVFEKNTKDCGHSTEVVKGCQMAVKDPNDVTILPLTEAVDLTDILGPETSKYLWSCFGHILPHALHDVATAQPKNPIHFLAHKLLFHKYSRTPRQLKEMQEEAEKYREKIFQDRKDQAIAKARAWKAKQVRRRKPEESDDAAERFALDAHRERLEFIRTLNYLDD